MNLLKLLGWGDRVDVYLSFKKNGDVKGVYPVGKEAVARADTEAPYIERWTIDMPEAGPLRLWLEDPGVAQVTAAGRGPAA
jgi:hypothetical protein